MLPRVDKGRCRLSDEASTDVDRLVRLADLAAEPTGGEALALARAALELIEGAPLSELPDGFLGYGWFRAEGHEARCQAAAARAACVLGPLAAGASDVGLAKWGFSQARLVDPYNEVLFRAAMETAELAGDAAWHAQCLDDLDTMLGDLDPMVGDEGPSTKTCVAYDRGRRALTGT
jgi:hypothetical protein